MWRHAATSSTIRSHPIITIHFRTLRAGLKGTQVDFLGPFPLYAYGCEGSRAIFQKRFYAPQECRSNMEMIPLSKMEVTLPRVLSPARCAVAVVSMSKQEFARLEVLLRAQSGRLRIADVAS